jgi:hypothetical protein
LDSTRSEALAWGYVYYGDDHIALQEQIDGVAVNWLEKVTDDQYQLKK